MSSAIESNILFYDHVIGLRDKDFTGQKPKGPEINDELAGGYNQIQKRIFRYSPSIFKGKVSGPISVYEDLTSDSFVLIDHAIKGTKFSLLNFVYMSNLDGGIAGHQATNSVVEQLNINVVSPDVATFDASIVSESAIDLFSFSKPTADCQKLLTWDKCDLTTSLSGEIEGFSISIKNTVLPIYVAGPQTLSANKWPTELRLGMQEVTGTISSYDFTTWSTLGEIIVITLGSKELKLHVKFQPPQSSATGDASPYISTINFVGVNDGPVWTQ